MTETATKWSHPRPGRRIARRILDALTCAVVLVPVLAGCGADGGGETAGPLAGEKIELVVPFSPGGGYDTYARQLAPALEKRLGATIAVVNEPGAGGLVATNEFWGARPDGTTIAIFNMVGHLGSALAEAPGVQYDATGFSYIGRISQEPDVVVTGKNSPLMAFDDVLAARSGPPLRFGAGGPGSLEYIDAVVLGSLFGLNSEVVTGFEGSSEASLSLLSGDVDLHALSLGSQLPGIEGGDTRPLLVVGEESVPELPGVKTVMDYASDANRSLLQNHTRLLESGRAFAAPPGTDPEVLRELRAAFADVVTDPQFAAEAAAAGRPVAFASGEDVQAMVEDLMQSPPEYVQLLKQAFVAG
jgi:tripartite-type tricarboxylate transporter receptor subunit TctC